MIVGTFLDHCEMGDLAGSVAVNNNSPAGSPLGGHLLTLAVGKVSDANLATWIPNSITLLVTHRSAATMSTRLWDEELLDPNPMRTVVRTDTLNRHTTHTCKEEKIKKNKEIKKQKKTFSSFLPADLPIFSRFCTVKKNKLKLKKNKQKLQKKKITKKNKKEKITKKK